MVFTRLRDGIPFNLQVARGATSGYKNPLKTHRNPRDLPWNPWNLPWKSPWPRSPRSRCLRRCLAAAAAAAVSGGAAGGSGRGGDAAAGERVPGSISGEAHEAETPPDLDERKKMVGIHVFFFNGISLI